MKGQIAKTNFEKKIAQLYGDKYIGTQDKKIYVIEDDGGEKVQLAITLTCPKIPVESVNISMSNKLDFEDDNTILATPVFQPAEITDEERETVNRLLSML